MFQVTRAPTLAGHWMLAVVIPASRAASQSVGTLMSSAYQYQPPWFFPSGSNMVLPRMPCLAGDTPVIKVVWLGEVTGGGTPVTPSANAPSLRKRRRLGIFSPCASAAVT